MQTAALVLVTGGTGLFLLHHFVNGIILYVREVEGSNPFSPTRRDHQIWWFFCYTINKVKLQTFSPIGWFVVDAAYFLD